jgi:hypothetical protein
VYKTGLKITVVVAILFVIGYQNCAPAKFSFRGDTPTPTAASSNNNIANIVQKFKPALVVRGINCIMCHTKISSNVITDFGHGDSKFFITENFAQYQAQMKGPWFGDYYGTWQLADTINGTVYIPRLQINDQNFLTSINQSGSLSLADIMNLDLGDTYYGPKGAAGAGPMTVKVVPQNGQPKVKEVSNIYIGAPTETQILALSTNPSDLSSGVESVGANSVVSGLIVKGVAGAQYITNDSSVVKCIGDVVIRGTLLLNNVTIDTNNSGCRLMVTHSVFVQGPILYSDMSGTQNLQISSATAILLGFGPSGQVVAQDGSMTTVNTLNYRFSSWYYKDSNSLTRAPGSDDDKISAIRAEGIILQDSLHDSTDASNCPTTNYERMVSYAGINGGRSTNLNECGVDYSRLLLNAPNIQSRYVGELKGVVIAEIALFAPGALNFQYDTIFDSNTVSILPLLGDKILDLEE